MTGHLLGAAGGLETVICAKSIIEQTMAPTINLGKASEGCDLDYVANEARKKDIKYVLNNSFGFGGTNSTVILKRHEA
jgi:3-oxoacyl-[acyl-carrier-protein] synthase II